MARRLGLDLVEISASAKPPVCRILDFGKYRYQQAKKGKDAKTQRTRNKVKEVKFRVRIEDHDYFTKIKRAEDFLGKGNKVKLSLMFRGREIEHKDLGFDTIARAVGDLDHIGHQDTPPRLAGRFINTMVSPLPENQRVFKYNEHEPED